MTQSGTAKTNWTSADGVSAADLIRIEQGIKDSLPKDGSEAMTGPLSVNPLTGKQLSVNTFLELGSDGGAFSVILNNAYYDYTTSIYKYRATSGALGARGIRFSYTNGLECFDTGSTAATADATFTPTWVKLWNANNDGNGSGLDADKVRGGTVGSFKYADNYKSGTAIPSTYPVEESIFFNSGGAGWPDSFGTVQTIKGTTNPACTQYYYPYNVDGPIRYRNGLFSSDTWTAWRTLWDTTLLRDNSGVLEYFSGGAWRAVGGVKSVQRGAFTAVSGVLDITIASVNTAKTTIHMNNLRTLNFNTQYQLELLNSTTLRFTGTGSGASPDGSISWEVVESY